MSASADRELRTLTEIRRPRRGSKARTLYLDGEAWRTVPVEVVRELGIGQGDLLDPAELVESEARLAPRFARERAYRLLAYRERSAEEIAQRLAEDGYDEALVRATVDDLVRSGLVDDERYARMIVRQLVAARGFGRQRALRELSRRGVHADLASALLEEFAPEEGEADRARTRAAGLVRPGDSVARLASRLVRRGYSTAAALRAAQEQLAAEGDDEDAYDGVTDDE
jgi:regulatory protein